jgi:hypothetical protein
MNIEGVDEATKEKGKKPLPGSARPVKFGSLRQRIIAFARARNGDGEFAPQTEDAPDPNAMARAYGAPAGRIVAAPGKKAVAAGALGATAAAVLLTRKLRKPSSLRAASPLPM